MIIKKHIFEEYNDILIYYDLNFNIVNYSKLKYLRINRDFSNYDKVNDLKN